MLGDRYYQSQPNEALQRLGLGKTFNSNKERRQR
jgi:hypothetical protein